MSRREQETDLRVRWTSTMTRLRTGIVCVLIVLASALVVPSVAAAQPGCAHGTCMQRPYGGYCQRSRWGRYGAKVPVRTAEEARKRLEEFYASADVVVGPVGERDLHYEAEIKDKQGAMVDRVIIDKRTGRIRSVY